MKKTIHLTTLLFFILSSIACQKHKTFNIEPCEELVLLSEVVPDFDYIIAKPFYVKASFNPNNSNEIVFIDKFEETVCIYNIETGVKRTLYGDSLEPLFAPHWGNKDWILLSLSGNIYKIKSNGDSLTQLTFAIPAFAPKWNMEANKFFYNTGGLISPSLTIICDENGISLDSLPNSMHGSWQHDSLLLLNDDWNGIIVFNPNTGYRENISNASRHVGGAGAVQWIDDEHFIETNNLGIFKVNYKTHEAITLPVDVCSSRSYRIDGFSEQSQKLIFTKIESEILDWHTIKQRVSIVTMNTDGMEEEEIIIPE